MKKSPLKTSILSKTATLAVGLGVVALSVVETRAAVTVAGFAPVETINGLGADSAMAMFLIGLAVGMVSGVALFFAYLVMREKAETEQDREIDALLNAISQSDGASRRVWGRGEDREAHESLETEGGEECRDPWERPADWWRHAGDDA